MSTDTTAPGGYATFDPSTDPVPLGRDATPIGVFRLVDGQYEPMPFLRCLAVDAEHEGGEPTQATFRYRFSDPSEANPDALAGFEQVYPIDATGPAVVRIDDRLVVAEFDPDGTPVLVFDGFAQVPNLSLGPDEQHVQITAFGAEVRAYDQPLAGSTWRSCLDPDTVEDVDTDLDLTFNPSKDGVMMPNMLKKREVWSDFAFSGGYPVFIDPTFPFYDPETNLIYDDKTNPYRALWTIAGAVRYLLSIGNPDQKYVQNVDFSTLDALFQIKVPKPGEDPSTVDPSDDSTYDLQDLTVPPDLNLEGRRWPEALRLLIEPFGYGFCFRLDQDDDDQPIHRLDLYRKDDPEDELLVDLLLQPAGATLDPGQTNLGSASLARDASALANQFWVTTAVDIFEGSLVLAPGFKISSGDLTAPLTNSFKLGDPGHVGTFLHGYRRWIADEAGEGHWDLGKSAWITDEATDLTDLLTPQGVGNAFGDPVIVPRRRPPSGQLYSKDEMGERLSAQLWISTDYAGKSPGVFDGSGTWQQVISGWELLDDCLGIRLTVKDPGDLQIGPASSLAANKKPMPFPSGKVNVIQALCAPKIGPYPFFYFRLTCGIPADRDLQIVANRLNSSITQFTVEQRDDARDRFARWTISASSHLNPGFLPIVVRDDTPLAQAYAEARRAAHEFGPTAGPVTIPRLTRVYEVGMKVRRIVGREVSLAQNAATDEKETIYPSVVRVRRVYDPEQRTELGLSDRRGEPRRIGR